MVKILLTNDDGPFSPGLWILYEAIKELGEIYIIVPETPKSASGLGITLHKPLRINKLHIKGQTVFLVNGTPSDIVYVALNVITGKLDLVLSGVNIGENVSMQVILSSGTVGAVLQGAIEGIPGIAFSAAVSSPEELEDINLSKSIRDFISVFVRKILERGYPSSVDIINVNFPPGRPRGVIIAPPARKRFSTIVSKRKDPRGINYYWLYGQPVEGEPGTDVDIVFSKGGIAITPLRLPLFDTCENSLKQIIDEINSILTYEGYENNDYIPSV